MMGKLNIGKFGGSGSIRTDAQRVVRGPGGDVAIPAGGTPVTGEDRLEFSSRGSEVGQLVDQVKTVPDVRVDEVNALRDQISAGAYNPPAEDVAEAIIRDERS